MRRRLVEEKGADPRAGPRHPQLGGLRRDSAGPEGQRVRARARARRSVRGHAFGQRRPVAEPRGADRGGRPAAVEGAADDRHRRRRIQAPGARARWPRRAGSTTSGSFPYQPKALLHDSFAAADAFVVSLKSGLEGFIVPSKVYGILAAGRPYIAATDPSCRAGGDRAGRRLRAAGGARRSRRRWPTPSWRCTTIPRTTREMGARARRAAWQFDRRIAVQAYHDLFERVAGIARAA